MRDYGIVTPAFWIGETGKKLRGDVNAQLLAMYLMTSPHSSMTGVFHCPVIYMAHETGMTFEGASKGLQRLCEVGFCEYDEASECVFVINMASFQIAESLKPGDNRIAGLKKEVAKMAPSIFKDRFIATYSVAFCLDLQPEKQSPSKAPSKPRTGSGARTGSGLKGSDEPPSDSTPEIPVVMMPLNDNTEFPIGQTMIDEWSLTYPAVNVVQELREMRTWSHANPSQRKTARGVNAFVVRWLGKEQDKGGGRNREAPCSASLFAGGR